MYNDIERITKGLEILSKYKTDAGISGKTAVNSMLETQEIEYSNITAQDRETLYMYGWRNRENSPYLWVLATKKGLAIERDDPDFFK